MPAPPSPPSVSDASPAEDGFRALVENSIDAVLVHDEGVILYANPAAAAMVSAPDAAALVGQTVWPFVHQDDLPLARARVEPSTPETERSSRVRIVRPDGAVVHVDAVSFAVRFAGRDCTQVVGRDVTDRVRADEALVRSEAQLARVLASTDLVLFRLEPTPPFRALFVSAAIAQNTGHGSEKLLAPDFMFEQIHPDDLAAVYDTLTREADHDRSSLEYRFRKADGGYLWASTVIHRVRDARGVVVELHGVSMDISERKLAEIALREKEAQLRQSAKMEAVGRLAGGIAHDFNNLLMVINSGASLLAEQLTDPTLRGEANEIAEAGERAARLTRQLLAFSRKSVIVPKPMRLDALLTDMEKLLARTLGENIALTVKAPPDLWLVKADVSHVEQVVMHLALNARDAMPDGGSLTLSLENVTARDGVMGDGVRLTVTDTGVGILPEVLPHIFEPFFTTRGDVRGTGLGLATVLGNVTRSGGTISVDSPPGHGTTFRVWLPRTDEPLAAPAPTAAPATARARPVPGSKGTILLVEDEGSVRALANRILTRAGYTTVEAVSGHDAIALYRLHPDRFDLVLTDLVMPEGSGRDVADAVRALRPGQPVLFMSGYSEEMISHRGLALPGVRLLNKPFSVAEMTAAVAEALQSAARPRPPE